MIPKPLDKIEKEDLLLLTEEQVCESRTIEFKQILDFSNTSKKIEFLKDLSAFANAEGGDLIYGMAEKGGCANSPIDLGISKDLRDKEQQRLENIIQSGLEPRLVGYGFNWVDFNDDKVALVVRVPQSWAAPHRVCRLDDTGRPHNRFYIRNTNGVHEMSVIELRSAFLLMASINDKILTFRKRRISAISSGDGPVLMPNTGKIMIHILPLASYTRKIGIDLERIYHEPSSYGLNYYRAWERRFNFDGLLIFAQNDGPYNLSYLQVYRNGILEFVDAHSIMPQGQDNKRIIKSPLIEKEIVKTISEGTELLMKQNVEVPFIIFITLLHVNKYHFETQHARVKKSQAMVKDMSHLVLPELILKEHGEDICRMAKQCFDILAQSFNLPKSPCYNDAGDWIAGSLDS